MPSLTTGTSVQERTFQVLHEVAVASSGVLDPASVAQIAVDGAKDLLGVDSAGLLWWDPQSDELRPLGENDLGLAGESGLRTDDGGAMTTAFRRRETVLVDDYATYEAAQPRALERGIRSVAVSPLIARDHAVGVLAARTFTPRTWTEQDGYLLGLLAAQVAPALEAARLHVESERRRAEAEALAELVRVGATERNPERVMALICEQAAKLIGADYDGIVLIEADGSRSWRGMWGNRSDDWRRSTRGRGTGPLGRIMRERRTILMEDVGADPATAPQTHLAEGGKTVLSTPLTVRDKVLGALTLGWRTAVKPTPDQVRLAEALAGYASTVLDNARAYADEQAARGHAESVADTLSHREQALRALHEVAVAAGGVLDPEALGRLVVHSARGMLGFDSAGLYWWDSAANVLRPLAESDPERQAGEAVLHSGVGVAGHAYRDGKTVVVDDYQSWSGRLPSLSSLKSAAAIPLRVEERTVGVLVVRSYRQRKLQSEEVHLLELLTAQVAPALEAARLHSESQRRRAEAEALAELARQGAVEHDTERLIGLICEQATKLAGSDYAGIRLVDETEGLTWRGMAGNRTDTWRDRSGSHGVGSSSQALAAGGTIVSRTDELLASGVKLEPLSVRRSEGAAVEMATPLIYRGAARGALVLGWRTDLEPSPDQIRVAEALAGYATVILENARAHVALAQQALYDELTELPNRRLFQDRLEQAILVARREARPIGLLLMDLDRFKEVNDTLGHQAGDVLLREVGKRLRAALRSSDTVARLGGDEFAAVLTSMEDSSGALIAANKLLAAAAAPTELRGQRIQIAGSIGIALCPEHGADPETLLRRADVAMYEAKRNGGGSAIYAPDMDRDHADRLVLGHDLRRAIEAGELLLDFQPRFNLATRAVDGVEALVRWNHPEQGIILPAHFIPLAEQTGLIRQLSRWVLEAVFEQRRIWRNAGLDLQIAVNLSMRDLHDPTLPDFIGQLAQTYREKSDWLIIEITEGAVMSDPATAQGALAKLRTLGAHISIDDFGTGYSSLAYLNQLAVDEIKVDQSFVFGMANDPKHFAIVRAAVEMGHALGAVVIAEGVEEKSALDALEKLGCDGAQGFHVCTPLAPADLVEWLRVFRGG